MVRIAEILERFIFQLQIKGLFVGLHYLATAVDDAGVTDFNRELVVCVLRSASCEGPRRQAWQPEIAGQILEATAVAGAARTLFC